MGIDLQTAIRRAVAGALLFWATIAGPASMDTRAQSWETVSRLPEPRAGAAAVELEGYVYIIGGRSHQSPPSATVFRYDPESNDWEDGDDAPPAMKDARVNATAAVLNGKIFVIGGRGPGGEVLQSVEVYDPELNEWLDYPDTKRQREGAAAIILRGHLFLIGGSDQSQRALETVEIFDVENDRWEEISEWRLDRARVSAAAAVLDESVFVFGGFNTFGPVGQVQQYDALSGSVSATDMPRPSRGALAATTVKRRILVIGGRTQDQILDITQIFYPDDSRWEDAAPLNTARYSFAAATVGDTVLVFGGLGDQGVPLSSVERLKALGTAAEGPVPPPDLTLGPPFPHPFSQETRFDYSVSLSASSHVTIQILDVTGRTVKTLIDGPQIPGLSQAVWRGDTDAGTRVANGLYIIRMRQGPFSIVRKAVRVGG